MDFSGQRHLITITERDNTFMNHISSKLYQNLPLMKTIMFI